MIGIWQHSSEIATKRPAGCDKYLKINAHQLQLRIKAAPPFCEMTPCKLLPCHRAQHAGSYEVQQCSHSRARQPLVAPLS